MTDVSVVMSVYDEPDHVQRTIESVLAQDGVDFEFIIISDGASDDVLEVVCDVLKHPRVKFIEQENQGLTKALINGCQQSSSPFIARIDAGDTMSKDRLKIQLGLLQENLELGIVTSWVEIQTVEGYFLYDLTFSDDELNKAIVAPKADDFRSPFHASVMFRRSIYEQVGGYRSEFYFAQDCDLWSRMIEVAKLHVIEKVLTKGIFSDRGISGKYASEQKQLLSLILQARDQRQKSMSEDHTLSEAKQLRPSKLKVRKQAEDCFSGLYFIAKILTDNKSKHALVYWRRVISCKPLSIKSWLFFLQSMVLVLSGKGNDG